MKLLISLFAALVLAGCDFNRVRPDFPEPPESAMESCLDLHLVPETDRLSVVLDVVTTNYAEYHICRAKVAAWQEWYTQQKAIYKGVK